MNNSNIFTYHITGIKPDRSNIIMKAESGYNQFYLLEMNQILEKAVSDWRSNEKHTRRITGYLR